MTSPTQNASAFDINADFGALMKVLQLDPKDAGGSIVFGGQDPVVPSKHRLGHHEPRDDGRRSRDANFLQA